MYIRKNYSPVLYHHLLNGLKEKAETLLNTHSPEEMRSILIKLQVKIRTLPPSSKQLSSYEISRAFYTIFRGTQKRPSEVSKYLEKHKSRYEDDVSKGELEKFVLGDQTEFKFSGTCFSNVSFLQEKLSRQDIISHFKSSEI